MEIQYDVNGNEIKPGYYVSVKTYPKGSDRGWVGISSYITNSRTGEKSLVVINEDTVYTDIGPKSIQKLKIQKPVPESLSKILLSVPRRWRL
jgi:hypothetical protein